MKSIIKKIFPLALSLITLNVGATNQNNESLEQMIERGLNRATSQSLLLAKTLESQSGILPRTYEKALYRLFTMTTGCRGSSPAYCGNSMKIMAINNFVDTLK